MYVVVCKEIVSEPEENVRHKKAAHGKALDAYIYESRNTGRTVDKIMAKMKK